MHNTFQDIYSIIPPSVYQKALLIMNHTDALTYTPAELETSLQRTLTIDQQRAVFNALYQCALGQPRKIKNMATACTRDYPISDNPQLELLYESFMAYKVVQIIQNARPLHQVSPVILGLEDKLDTLVYQIQTILAEGRPTLGELKGKAVTFCCDNCGSSKLEAVYDAKVVYEVKPESLSIDEDEELMFSCQDESISDAVEIATYDLIGFRCAECNRDNIQDIHDLIDCGMLRAVEDKDSDA